MTPNLKSNLETFFTLSHPKYEILLCVPDQDNPAIDACKKKMLAIYPVVDVSLFVGGRKMGIKTEINNATRAPQLSYHPWSNIFFWGETNFTEPGIKTRSVLVRVIVSVKKTTNIIRT